MQQAANDNIDPNAPLRLADAIKESFPRGGMTVSGLRREHGRGRLHVEMIAGKQFTTLAAIEEMRRLCRADPKVLTSGSVRSSGNTASSSRARRGLSST